MELAAHQGPVVLPNLTQAMGCCDVTREAECSFAALARAAHKVNYFTGTRIGLLIKKLYVVIHVDTVGTIVERPGGAVRLDDRSQGRNPNPINPKPFSEHRKSRGFHPPKCLLCLELLFKLVCRLLCRIVVVPVPLFRGFV